VAIGLHLAGLAWHTFRSRENIAWSMIDGRKAGPPAAALASPHRVAGVVVTIVAAAWSAALLRSYDANLARVRLPVLGTEIRLDQDRLRAEPPPDFRRKRQHE
jgi:hypothetical protein